jgi:uncharacterized Zn finger protein
MARRRPGRRGGASSRYGYEYDYDSRWPPYVSAAEHRQRAARARIGLQRAKGPLAPVRVEGRGRKIASTFWGQAWCRNLEAYSDFSNRLPRGRTYVRNGSVLDLRIEAGCVRALVSGSDIYRVEVEITKLPARRWAEIKGQCAGAIDSLVELLRGSLSKSVMEIVTRKGEGLFPAPREISLSCSCPDWARMCKHVAATLYGVGVRLDREPSLLFTLRGVDPGEMVEAAAEQPQAKTRRPGSRLLESDGGLSAMFGVEIDEAPESALASSEPKKPARRARPAKQSEAPPKRRTTKATKGRTTGKPSSSAKSGAAANKPAPRVAASRRKVVRKAPTGTR